LSSFNFKSSGTRVKERVNTRDERLSLDNQTFGIRTPVQNFRDGQIFDMHTDVLAQLKDNLRNLILTNRGERLGFFDFGANLTELVFEYENREDYVQEITKRIIDAVNKHIPVIEVTNVTLQKLDRNKKYNLNRQGLASVSVLVEFSIPNARVTNQGIIVELNPGG
jgi:phage baseplate assembly protein W